MNPQQAHDLLGLFGGEATEEIEQAYQTRLAEIDKKIAGTAEPAAATKLKARRLDLAEAHTFLLRQTMNSATGTSSTSDATTAPPQTFQIPSGLSATMMADLPGAHPYQTALGTGGNLAQIASLQPGHVLVNRFEIKAQIGAGGMGAVYRAHDRNRGEDIAIKVMLPGLISSDVAKQRFMNEAKIAIKLGHQHIVNTYDVQMDGAYIFITMELLEGTNLRQLMTEKKQQHQQWSETEVLDIIRPLCEALTYAHRFTIHRDIKPENVWINRDGSIKLMDFGIARLMTDSQMTQTSAVLGTAYYMAPEQLTGAKGVDHRADQYSVGVMVYELLTERIPTGRFKPISEIRNDISHGLSAAVDQALAGHPEDRYADMAAFAQALQQGGMTSRRSASTANKTGASNNGMMIWAGVGLAVIVLAAGIVLFSSGSKPVAPAQTQAAETSAKPKVVKEFNAPTMIRIPGKNYEMGKYEVTQAQWKAVMGNNPSHFSDCGSTCPVENVSWDDIQSYLKKLNVKTGKQYRLPTEAEWEYACYGGSRSKYCGGNDIDAVAWYGNMGQPGGNSNQTTHPVGQKQANGYGLYDMSGNVWEWMENWYDSSQKKLALRGGSWYSELRNARAADRNYGELAYRFSSYGFRLARTLP